MLLSGISWYVWLEQRNNSRAKIHSYFYRVNLFTEKNENKSRCIYNNKDGVKLKRAGKDVPLKYSDMTVFSALIFIAWLNGNKCYL